MYPGVYYFARFNYDQLCQHVCAYGCVCVHACVYLQASLHAGLDLKQSVDLPPGEDPSDWIAVHGES